MKEINKLSEAIQFFQQVMEERLKTYFQKEITKADYPLPKFHFKNKENSKFLEPFIEKKLQTQEVLVIILALMPHLFPGYLDEILKKHINPNDAFPLFGGYKGIHHRGILPTGETALFLLAGNNLSDRLEAQKLLLSSHRLQKEGIILLEKVTSNEPVSSGQLIITQEYLKLFLIEEISLPSFSMEFPAQLITTSLNKTDLVLDPKTMNALEELETWINNHKKLQSWSIGKFIKPGYRALFHGPSGTGKTISANILGKRTGLPVYRINLPMVISKYIGETEKNLSRLFRIAENNNWILFFDEADALFGKRTGVRNSHDRYANQEVSYLLQRIEDYDGLVILASNLKGNIDSAYLRRFQSIIHFPMPNQKERLTLWQKILPKEIRLSKEIDLELISQHYELNGASIVNIVEYACLLVIKECSDVLTKEILQKSIKRKYVKEGNQI